MPAAPVLRSLLASTTLLLACGGQATLPDPEDVRASLIAADEEFAAATAANRLEGWMAAFDSTAIQLSPDVPYTQSAAAIRASMAPAFADTSWQLTWQPTLAFASADGSLGYTLGSYQGTRRDAEGLEHVSTGKYVTIWRKQAEGGWKVVFDGGNPDSQVRLPVVP